MCIVDSQTLFEFIAGTNILVYMKRDNRRVRDMRVRDRYPKKPSRRDDRTRYA